MEADKHDVVCEQHEGGEMVSNPTLSKDVVAKVADVSDLRVEHDVFVHGQRGDVEENAGDDHGDDTGNPTQNGQ